MVQFTILELLFFLVCVGTLTFDLDFLNLPEQPYLFLTLHGSLCHSDTIPYSPLNCLHTNADGSYIYNPHCDIVLGVMCCGDGMHVRVSMLSEGQILLIF